jgi:hypothetical protein
VKEKRPFAVFTWLFGWFLKRLLQMFEYLGKWSISAFLANCMLNKPMKVTEINKSIIDFVMLLSSFFVQFRTINNNFNQAYYSLIRNFGEKKPLR